ncbi:MAG: hypothetical protein H7255_18560 [Ramlibacter sp.]|nr:hypothetical protein [Ramlibacter sp.]
MKRKFALINRGQLMHELSTADDRILLSNWLPRQAGVVPKVRFGEHWVNVLWALPLIFVLLVIGVTASHALRQVAAVLEFLVRYPGIPNSAIPVTTGFTAPGSKQAVAVVYRDLEGLQAEVGFERALAATRLESPALTPFAQAADTR